MFDDTLARPSALHGVNIMDSLREAAAWLPFRSRRRAVAASPALPCAWMAMPPERALPRDLDLPLSAFDPGAFGPGSFGGRARMSVAGFVDPMVLERTLQRIPAR